jgi:hypothetical protein
VPQAGNEDRDDCGTVRRTQTIFSKAAAWKPLVTRALTSLPPAQPHQDTRETIARR